MKKQRIQADGAARPEADRGNFIQVPAMSKPIPAPKEKLEKQEEQPAPT